MDLRFIFGDALSKEELEALGHISDKRGFGLDEEKMEIEDKSGSIADEGSQPIESDKVAAESEHSKEQEEDLEESEQSSESSDIKSEDSFVQLESQAEEEKNEFSMQEDFYQPQNKDSGIKRSLFSPAAQPRHKVQFEDEKVGKGVDLPKLISTKNEIIYRLTELYLPKTDSQRKKMLEYNMDKLLTQNDGDNEHFRTKKRKMKEEIKNMKQKLKHQIKYANPNPLLEDVNYLYKEGMTSKQLELFKERGKYSNAHFIGRILPSKRPMNQALIDQQRGQIMEQLKDTKPNVQEELKSYVMEDELQLKSDSLIKQWDKEVKELIEPKLPETLSKIEEQRQYEQVCLKIQREDISLGDLSNDEREILRTYLKRVKDEQVMSNYPLPQYSNLEKQCFYFMKHLNVDDFSFKGHKSALQSDDTQFFDELGLGGGGVNMFNMTNANTTDDRMSVTSDPFGIFNNQTNNQGSNGQAQGDLSDAALQEWIIEQKYKIIGQSGRPVKRRRYWGEPKDCNTWRQLALDEYKYKQHQNKLFYKRGGQDEKLFKIERIQEEQKKDKNGKLIPNQPVPEEKLSVDKIKDIKEYEYFKEQESYFYQDLDKRTSVNSIMRNVQRQLGLITDEEFFAQEELADKHDQQNSRLGTKDKQRERLIDIETRKNKICDDLIDNFDYHFEKRKKELHDSLLKKIQQHEKANQQPPNQPTTVAYASGSHALLQAQSALEKDEGNRDKIKSLVNINKMVRDDHELNKGQYVNEDEDMIDEENKVPHQKHHHEGIAEPGMGIRVTKSRANELNHAKCILKLTFNKFDWQDSSLQNFHRPNIQEIFDSLTKESQVRMSEKKSLKGQSALSKSSTQIVIEMGTGQSKVNEGYRDDQNIYPVDYVQVPLGVISHDQVESRIKKSGIINAHEYFKDRFKLSLRDGKFCIFEHIDQNPLFVNNFGMASKLKRYIYSDHPLPQEAYLKKLENQGTRHMGPHGVQILKKKGEKIPLLGQIDSKYYKGLTVLENNMYYSPVFYHKANRNDFLCVMHRDKRGNNQLLVRDLTELYVVGQEEPKLEVYNPQSRHYQHFIKRRTQAYVIRFLQENHNYISFVELNHFFPYINDQILKKIIKEINVDVDRQQCCSLQQEYNDEQFRALITPENICQYESAQFGEFVLKKVGITDITNADKISYAANKFCSEEPNKIKQVIARIIEEEVLSTPWNLSQSFILNKQTRGMMMLEGIGDPSNGHGGYSYLKLPLKISQDSLNKAKHNRMYLNPAIQNPKAVTGTDADLRKLSKKEIKNKLIDLGFKDEQIASFTRWEMVALLREKSSQAVSQGMEGDMKKFARGVRFTSKKQREMYQKQVNDIFKKQMNYLSQEKADFISDQSDTDARDEYKKKMNDLQQMNNNYSKNTVELKEDLEITNIQQIPNYQVLLMASQPQSAMTNQPSNYSGMGLNIGGNSGGSNTGIDLSTGNLDANAAAEALKQRLMDGGMTLRCKILKKKIKGLEGDNKDKVERVIFCSDTRQIKGFSKRKHKNDVKTKRTKKTSLKEKMQTSKLTFEDLNKDRKSDTSSVFRQNLNKTEQSDIKIKISGLDTHSMDGTQSERLGGTSQIAINLGAISQKPQKKSYQRYNSTQISLANQTFDQMNQGSNRVSEHHPASYYEAQEAAPAKITLSLSGMGGEQEGDSSYRAKKSSGGAGDFSIGIKKEKKPKKELSKFAQTSYNDDDFESYKPKTQNARRRQTSPEFMLNDLFATIIDKCIMFDTSKIFHYPVKKKDAPNYYDVIKNPMDLTSMKNKSKRNEYYCHEQFLEDFALMRQNSELYNGVHNPIAQLGRDIENYAKELLENVMNDIKNLELLVKEKKEGIVI